MYIIKVHRYMDNTYVHNLHNINIGSIFLCKVAIDTRTYVRMSTVSYLHIVVVDFVVN